MHPVVNLLVQLQELVLIRDEQRVTSGKEHLERLDDSIRTMTAELPADIRRQFTNLHKRDHVVIVPISEGICVSCGMKLPISLVQAVRLGREVLGCPNCARLLFAQDSAARRQGKNPRRTAAPKIGISRFSSKTLMVPKLASEDRDGVIEELAGKMEHEGFIDHGDKLVEAALSREALLSTALDHGLAFPHVRGVEGGGLTLALGVSPKGLHFNEGDKALSRIIFFIVIPMAASAFYLKLLAGLSQTFVNAESRNALLEAKDEDTLWKTLCKVTRTTIK